MIFWKLLFPSFNFFDRVDHFFILEICQWSDSSSSESENWKPALAPQPFQWFHIFFSPLETQRLFCQTLVEELAQNIIESSESKEDKISRSGQDLIESLWEIIKIEVSKNRIINDTQTYSTSKGIFTPKERNPELSLPMVSGSVQGYQLRIIHTSSLSIREPSLTLEQSEKNNQSRVIWVSDRLSL